MNKILMPIDTKSLHYNIKNDNKTGHTAMVATPLKQGNSFKEDLGQILKLPHNIDFESKPDLIKEILKNTRIEIKVTDVFVFDKISVNNEPIDTESQFCIYLREEVDPTKFQCGRIKVHYPITFKYEDEDINIDNRKIMQAVSSKLCDYSFLVNAFEYDFHTNVLNFQATIVGENQIPYSKVFINEKEVENKFSSVFNKFLDTYDMEIISLKNVISEDIDPNNYFEIMQENKNLAMRLAKEYLKEQGSTWIRELYKEYPYSLYDFEYYKNGSLKYLIVTFTSTKLKYFNLSIKKINFLNDFNAKARVLLITDINVEPKLYNYSFNDISVFKKSINSMMYISEE